MKRTAIVTGGSRGIGLGIVRELAKDGFSFVIVGSSPEERCLQVLEDLRCGGTELSYIQTDISSVESIRFCVQNAVARLGRIDVLVNDAGVAPTVRTDLLEMTEESFNRVVGINTRGTLFMCQSVARLMVKQDVIEGRRGIIVNVSSVSADVSSVNRGEYCISKAGISMVTRLFADRLAKDAVWVYEVRPGIIATDMTAKVKDKYDKLFAAGLCPISRWGTPEDVGRAVEVFCSGRLSYSTGQVINVDGGFERIRSL